MALTKINLKPGINREVTRYSGEGGWRSCDKIRFRQGFPEKIGGWQRLTQAEFVGVCRSLTEWVTLNGTQYRGVGTSVKYYVERGGAYFDLTPLRATSPAGDVTFAATAGSPEVTVTHTAHGAADGAYVTFSGAVSLGGSIPGALLNAEYRLTVVDVNTYTIDVGVPATAGDTGTGGGSVVGAYQINPGAAIQLPVYGWSADVWGADGWGLSEDPSASEVVPAPTRVWNHSNYGEDLVFGPRGGALYYWTSSDGVDVRGVQITGGDAPTVHLAMLVSDMSRFVVAFGCNELGDTALDPLLVRWSDQEQYNTWTPAITNQAGGQRLSIGSTIVAAKQNRQEILVWTDAALYSMQYQGPPYVWGFQLMGENLSIASPQAVATAGGIAYWMGTDKFYRYDGRVQPLPCDLKRHVFSNINYTQLDQVVAGTIEQFNEIWWFYPSATATTNDSYVVYNYIENIWYYGTMERTAWLDSALSGNPVAAYQGRLVMHEVGCDDMSTETPAAISAFIESAEVDIGDGDKFAFIRRLLPDVTFADSTADNPRLAFTLEPLRNSGSGYKVPPSVGGVASGDVTASRYTNYIEEYTGQVNIRVRGRQITMRIQSDDVGVKWQLGSPRIDMQVDGYK